MVDKMLALCISFLSISEKLSVVIVVNWIERAPPEKNRTNIIHMVGVSGVKRAHNTKLNDSNKPLTIRILRNPNLCINRVLTVLRIILPANSESSNEPAVNGDHPKPT